MMAHQPGLARWMAGVAVPVALVVLSLTFLAALAAAAILGSAPERGLYGLFALGVGGWVLGVGWGVVANGERRAPRA